MSDLSEFLLARIAEDEEAARAAIDRNGAEWGTNHVQDGTTVTGDLRREANPRSYGEDDTLWDDEGALGMWNETAAHVARWDPARVLAECEAKRRIVELHSGSAEWCGWTQGDLGTHGDMGNGPADCDTAKLLALPYADHHPAYREEWRP